MIVLLDTSQVPERDRADALQSAFRGESPQRVVFADQHRSRRLIEVVDFGPGTHLIRNVGAGVQITRDARHVQMAAPETLSIGFQRGGTSLLSRNGVVTECRPGHLLCVDNTSPYAYAERGVSAHHALIISNEQVGVSVDVVRAAAPALALSSVYELVRNHAARLFDATRDLPEAPRLLAGQATLALVRALLTTAAQIRAGRDNLEDTLELRVSLYIDAHLGDQDLSPERIAAAHNLSLRHLYTMWARAAHEQTLTEEIIHRRLHRAKEQLTTSRTRASIQAIARDCGFRDASHFSRRFRASFGMSPAQCRTSSSLQP